MSSDKKPTGKTLPAEFVPQFEGEKSGDDWEVVKRDDKEADSGGEILNALQTKTTKTIKDAIRIVEESGGSVGVGHTGLYWEADGGVRYEDEEGNEAPINVTVELGASGKGKLLTICEEGIANVVQELADDEDNHLPNAKTGVVVHYVLQGIARDFKITFDGEPTSLSKGRGGSTRKTKRIT